MYLLRINYNGFPFLFKVKINWNEAIITKEISNHFHRQYDSRPSFKKSYIVSSTKNLPKTTQTGRLFYRFISLAKNLGQIYAWRP